MKHFRSHETGLKIDFVFTFEEDILSLPLIIHRGLALLSRS